MSMYNQLTQVSKGTFAAPIVYTEGEVRFNMVPVYNGAEGFDEEIMRNYYDEKKETS